MSTEFDISGITGLDDREAAERQRQEGYNELPSSKPASLLAIAFSVVREPIFMLLVAGGITYLILGDVEEALMLLGFVVAVIGITIYQERKTERALEALRDLSSPRALVIRGGVRKRIAGRDVVRGDNLIIAEGDRVPADAVLIAGTNVAVDESLLTGESVPVRKKPEPGVSEMATPGGEDQPFLYSGTMVVSGQGVAEVKAIGACTELGKIGVVLRAVEPEDTLLQRETRRLVRDLGIIGITLSIALVIIYGAQTGMWVRGVLTGITLAMAILPEEFPVVLTVFLALGAWRISQNRVLTRRVPAVETLGAATVLCVDKTGTLTLNQMTVKKLFAQGETLDIDSDVEIPEAFHPLVEFSILASQRDPFDPMEKAIRYLGEMQLAGTEHIHTDWDLVREYPLSPELLAVSQVWRSPEGRDYIIAAKGAPEAIFSLCHLDEATKRGMVEQTSRFADEGLRVLGVAASSFHNPDLPNEQHAFDFVFLGLIGLADPVRPTVPEAVQECYNAGIRVVMITGDYAGTARSIARQAGFGPREECITGAELDQMSDDELRRRIENTNIFARVVPQQKLRLVNALKANGEVVAMTGDGVNDAPALKSANIGIAMGARGTDVARESAGLVLLDDDFSSIVKAVALGRRIFDNLKKATSYIFAIHVPIIGLSLLPVLLKWPLILMPIHIAFLELIIDPASSIAFEAEPAEEDVMNRPPRDPREPLYSRRTIVVSVLQGLGIFAVIAAIFAVTCCVVDVGMDKARAMAYTTLIFSNLALILTNRSWLRTGINTLRSPNPALWYIITGALVSLGLVLYVPALRSLFRFAFLNASDIAICFGAGLGLMIWFEVLKRFILVRRYPRP